MIRRILFTISILIALATPALAGVNAVATLPWIGSVAKEIGKDKVDVTVLVKPNQDPHFAEAKPSMILAASKADVIIYNGLDLEIGYLPLIVRSSRNPRIQPGQEGNIDCSRYVNAIERPHGDIDRGMGDVHPLGNPHYLFSPDNVLRVAEGIARGLSSVDPDNAAFYKANLVAFREKFRMKEAGWRGAGLKGVKFIACHKIFEYLAAEFGFEIAGYVEPKPGIPPSAGHIDGLIESIKRTKPSAILCTANHGLNDARSLAARTGLRVIVLPQDVGAHAEAKDWFTFMDAVISSLEKGR